MIGVDVLPEQREFARPASRKLLDFVEDLGGRARSLRPPRIGHDAERAELVAALLHGDKALTPRERIASRLAAGSDRTCPRRKFGVDHAPRAAGDKFGQAVVVLPPDDEIHRGLSTQDSAPSACATQPATTRVVSRPCRRPRQFELANFPEFGIYFFRGALPDVAGVEHDEVGVLDR